MARISLLGGLARIGSALFTAAPIGCVILGAGNGIVSVIRLPQVIGHSYWNLWRTPRLGPVAKVTLSVALPIGIAAVPPLATLASAIAGIVYYGFWKGMTETSDNETFLHVPMHGAAESFKAVADFWKGMGNAFLSVDNAGKEPLKPGEQAYEIRIIDGIRGVVSAFAAAPYEAICLTAVTLRYWPEGVYRMHKMIWNKSSDIALLEAALMLAMEIVGLVAAVIAVPLTPVVSLVAGVYDTCVEGYKNGIRSAFGKATGRVQSWRENIKAIVTKDNNG